MEGEHVIIDLLPDPEKYRIEGVVISVGMVMFTITTMEDEIKSIPYTSIQVVHHITATKELREETRKASNE